MENASKALLMAAGILIGVVILSLAVYLYATFSTATGDMQKQMEQDEINTFNNQFLAYLDKEDLTIYDVCSVANLAEENNKKYELESEGKKEYNYYVRVDIKSTHDFIGKHNIEKNKLTYDEISSYYNTSQEKLTRFKCVEVRVNDNTQRVDYVVFQQI